MLPALSVALSLQRAVLVHGQKTDPITWASLAELVGIAAMLALLVLGFDWIGAVAAMASIVFGRVVANLVLIAPERMLIRQYSS